MLMRAIQSGITEIKIKVIPHEHQHYPTVGDWRFAYTAVSPQPYLLINVSDMNNSDYEFLVGIHELIEAYLCQKRGIKEEDVTAFDIEYEKNRVLGDDSEPGDDLDAPYHKEHVFATNIEKQLAAELGVDWDLYDKTIQELCRFRRWVE